MIITKQPSLVDMVAEYERTIGMLLAALRKAAVELDACFAVTGNPAARDAANDARAAIAAATANDFQQEVN